MFLYANPAYYINHHVGLFITLTACYVSIDYVMLLNLVIAVNESTVVTRPGWEQSRNDSTLVMLRN